MRKTSSLPNSIADSTSFPFGAIQDKATGVTGTPVIEATYSDFIQNLWHFVALAGITPNGLQDNVTNGFQLAKALQVILEPVGSVRDWASSASFPLGYVARDGRSLSKTTYPDLFAVIGYTYGGSGDNFNIPNSIDKFIVGAGNLYSVGATGGEATHILSSNEIPSHAHKMVANDQSSAHSASDYPTQYLQKNSDNRAGNNDYNLQVGTTAPTLTPTETVGGGGAHNNLPPYQAMTPIIKIQYV